MEITTTLYSSGAWSEPLPASDTRQTLVLAFGAPSLGADVEWREDLRARFPNGVVVGCSSPGEILGDRLFDHAVSVAALRFDHSSVRTATAEFEDAATTEELGQQLGAELAEDDLRAVLVFADGAGNGGAQLIAGIRAAVDRSVLLSGGIAAPGTRLDASWVLSDGECRAGCAVAVGLYGPQIRTQQSCEGGWIPFGPERQVTRAQNNLLVELDDGPALSHCALYLGEFADELRTEAWKFPLAVRREGSAEGLICSIVEIDEQNQTLTCNEEIPQDCHVQLLRGHPDDLIDGAAAAAAQSTASIPSATPVFALGVSGAARRQLLGSEAEDELAAIHDALPDSSRMVGFYAQGEFTHGQETPALQHQTMALTTIWEEPCTAS